MHNGLFAVGDAKLRYPPRPLLERDTEFASREVRAEAAVRTGGKTQVTGLASMKVDFVWIVVESIVA